MHAILGISAIVGLGVIPAMDENNESKLQRCAQVVKDIPLSPLFILYSPDGEVFNSAVLSYDEEVVVTVESARRVCGDKPSGSLVRFWSVKTRELLWTLQDTRLVDKVEFDQKGNCWIYSVQDAKTVDCWDLELKLKTFSRECAQDDAVYPQSNTYESPSLFKKLFFKESFIDARKGISLYEHPYLLNLKDLFEKKVEVCDSVLGIAE